MDFDNLFQTPTHWSEDGSTWHRIIRGGDETADDGGEGGNDDAGADGGDGKTFTQEQVTRIAKREADQAKRKAAADLAETLGVPVEEARKILADHRAKVEADQSELDKAKRAAADEKRRADEAEAKAADIERRLSIREALVEAGITKRSKLDKAVRLVDVGDDGDIDAAVAELKDEMPELFAAKADDENEDGKPSRKTTPPPPKPGNKPKPADAEAQAKAQLERRQLVKPA